MIKELEKENIFEIKHSFLSRKIVLQELENNPFAKYLIYIEKGKVIGYIYYSDIYDRAEINQIEVDISHRNCGKATEMIKKLTELVNKNITLEVREDNIAAIRLYKKFNFKKVAIREGYYNGIDGVLMERKIDRSE